jgi:hypothetical protein
VDCAHCLINKVLNEIRDVGVDLFSIYDTQGLKLELSRIQQNVNIRRHFGTKINNVLVYYSFCWQ